MPLERSATHIYCQTCANAWELNDQGTGHYFRGELGGSVQDGHNIGDYTSPAAIVAIDPAATMTFCPRCDVEQLAEAYRKPAKGIQESPFYRGDSRMIETDPDNTDGQVPDAEAGGADNAITNRVS